MKKHILIILIIFSFLFSLNSFSQINGTRNIPGDMSIAQAFDSCNLQGIGTGGIIFNISAGYIESASNLTLTTITTDASKQIVFQKSGSGANPLIIASSGTSASYDGIIKIAGTDYVTFDGLDLMDTAVTGSNTVKMEWGYALLITSSTNGSQNITIKNCTISLIIRYPNTIGIYSARKNTAGSAFSPTAFSGTNSYNKFYSDSITGAYQGIYLEGYNVSSPYLYYDHFNEIGVEGANKIYNFGDSTSTAYGIYCIYQDSIKIANNTVDNSANGTAAILFGIYLNTSGNAIAHIYGNKVTIRSRGTTQNMHGIANSAGSTLAGTSINIYNNIIEGCSYSTATTGLAYMIYNTGNPDTLNIYGNIIRNDSTHGTGNFTGIYVVGTTNTTNVYSNQVYNISKTNTSGAGTIYGITGGNSNYNCNLFSNIIKNISLKSASTGAVIGLSNTVSPSKVNYYNNTIDTLVTAGTGDVTGLNSSESGTPDKQIYDNNIFSLKSYGGNVRGLTNDVCDSAFIYRNKIYDLEATSVATKTAYGINNTSGTNVYYYNNYVSDLRAPVSTNVAGICGFYISGTASSRINLYYNTIYIKDSSTSATFGSAGVYASTTPILEMKNNIIVNLCKPGNSTYDNKTCAYRRSSTTITTYSNNSNYNCFYAGPSTTDTARVLFYNGTRLQYDMTINSYKSRVSPRDMSSFRELPPFKNISSKPYDMRLDSNTVTQCESGAGVINIPPITSDFDIQARFPNPGYPNHGSGLYDATAPDVGADEIGGMPSDIAGPSITYDTLGKGGILTGRTLSNVIITDPSGVDSSTGTKPRIYFRKTTNANTYVDNTSSTNGWKFKEANNNSSPFEFSIDYSLIYGGVNTGDTIQYFVIAQDLSATPNISVNAGSLTLWPTSVNLAAGNFPILGNVKKYPLSNPFSGTVYVGAGQTYTSLTANSSAGLFNAINNGVLTGHLDICITSDLTETGAIALNQYIEEVNSSITVKPYSDTVRTISGPYNGGLIRLNGADKIAFDGRYNGSGNYLTIKNDSARTNTAAVQFISLGTNQGCNYDTIRNCNILTDTNYSNSFGIFIAGASVSNSGTGADNDNISIIGNNIYSCYYGIFARGTASPGFTDSLIIRGNIIGKKESDTSLTVRFTGIDLNNINAAVVSDNEIVNIMNWTNYVYAINNSGAVTNSRFFKNKIHGIKAYYVGNYGAIGIYFANNSGISNNLIYNNIIYDILNGGGSTSYTYNPIGIKIDGGSDYGIYYNSVNLFGPYFHAVNSDISSPVAILNAATGVDLRNNIFANSMTGTGAATGKAYAIMVETGTVFNSINNNVYYSSGPKAMLGFFGSDKSTIELWRAATGKDSNSTANDPIYQNDTLLEIQLGSSSLQLATPISGIERDYIDTLRNLTNPTSGAYEKNNGKDTRPPIITYTAITNGGTGESKTLSNFAVITDAGSGIDTNSGSKPRIYYKKITDSNTYSGNTPDFSCWKWTKATNAISPFSFVIDYTKLYPSGTVSLGDTIQYFVVAQDAFITPNVGVNSATFAVNPVSVNLTSAQFPVTGTINKYYLMQGFSGNINVGTGQTYTTLTGSGGLFEAINSGLVRTDLNVFITSDISEPGTVALNQTNEEINFRIRILPNSAVNRTLSGKRAGGLIRLNGADRVTIDGRFAGSGNYLTIINDTTISGATAIHFISLGTNQGCNYDTIRNCNISTGSNSNSTYGIFIGGTSIGNAGSDNDYNAFIQNYIYKARFGFYLNGSSSGTSDSISIIGNTIGSDTTANRVGNYGVYLTYVNGATIRKNIIKNIINTNTNNVGMYVYTSVTNSSILQNKIYGIKYSGSSDYGATGMSVQTGNSSSNLLIYNNAISDISGKGSTNITSYGIAGMKILANTGGIGIYHNSVYLFGDISRPSAIGDISTAFFTVSTASNLDLRNNIFVNGINNTTGLSQNFAIYSLAPNTAYTDIDYNDYYAYGEESVLGMLGGNRFDIVNWQYATGKDTHSISADPLYNSGTLLQPLPGTPVLNIGTPITGITTDMVDTARSLTNPSIGAYEKDNDITPPSFTYTPLKNSALTSSRILNSYAVITDPRTVDTTAGLKPRIYYRRTSDSNTYTGNTSSFSCWKWKEADNNSSPFSFTIDYSLLYPSGTVTLGDTIQYFMVAQDMFRTPNVGISSGSFNIQPLSVALTSSAFPVSGAIDRYSIVPGISGTVNVGVSQTYTTLTGSGGLFEAINNGSVTGNITAFITSDITEPGTFPLNETSEDANYTITIKPDAATLRTISGNDSLGLVKFNGADRIIIDGSFGGSGSYLLFRNSHEYGPVIILYNTACNDSLRNLIIESGNSYWNSGALVFGGTDSRNSDNYIFNCEIRKINNTLKPGNNVYFGPNAINKNNIINNCTLKDAVDYGIYMYSARDSGNIVRNCSIIDFGNIGIYLEETIDPLIEYCNIYHSEFAGYNNYTGILVEYTNNAVIRNNKIHDFKGYNFSDYYGIQYWGESGSDMYVSIYNNAIYFECDTTTSSKGYMYGIYYYGYFDNNCDIYYNSIYIGGSNITDGYSYCINKDDQATTMRIMNNMLLNERSNASGFSVHYCISINDTTAFDTLNINYNNYYATGTGGILGNWYSTDISDFSVWKTTTGRDSNSKNTNPSVNSASNLTPQPGSPLLLSAVPVSGITRDIIDSLRNETTPAIGAYEKPVDMRGPDISYTALTNTTSVSNRVLVNFASITDATGIDTNSGTKPRIYYKKSTDNNSFGGNTSTDNGWKWKEASNNLSPFSFTIDYSLLYGGSANLGDVIQYFIVAQDVASPPNVSAQKSSGFSGTSVSSVTSAPSSPDYYAIIGASPLSGDYTVGLSTFNLLTGKNLVSEKRTREVIVEVKEPLSEITEKESKSYYEKNKKQELTNGVNTKTEKKENLFSEKPENKKLKKSSEFKIVKKKVTEEYCVLTENGKEYKEKLYFEFNSEGSKSKKDEFALSKNKINGKNKISNNAETKSSENKNYSRGVYATLTAAVEDLKTNGVSGPVRFLLTDTLYNYEMLPVNLTPVTGASSTNTITIKPQTSKNVVISGNSASSVFYLRGGDFYIIDGSNTSDRTTKNLTIRNRNLNGSVVKFENAADSNTVKNCIIESPVQQYYAGVIQFGDLSVLNGNRYNTILNNDIRNHPDTALYPYQGIYVIASGTGDTTNSYNIIIGNNIYNFIETGIWLDELGTGPCWNIIGNSVFDNTSGANSNNKYGIYVYAPASHTNYINGNFIGGSAPNCGGSPLIIYGINDIIAVYSFADINYPSSIQGNVIQNISMPDTTGYNSFMGLYLAGGYHNVGTDTGNIIGHNSNPNSIIFGGAYMFSAIYSYGKNNIVNNIIANIKTDRISPAPNIWGICVQGEYEVTVEKNYIHDIGPANGAFSGGSEYNTIGVYLMSATTPSSFYTVQNNIIRLGKEGINHNIMQIGILSTCYGGTSDIYNNSILIYDTASADNTKYSACIRKQRTGITNIFNNLLVNKRNNGTGGIATNYCIYCDDTTNFTSNNNLFYVLDETTMGFWKAERDFYDWKSRTKNDFASYFGTPPLLSDLTLQPDSTNSDCWMLNAKGMPLASVPFDFRGLPRDTSVTGGPTDIGAYEFTTSTIPPFAVSSGNPVADDTTFYYQAERKLLEILWGVSKNNIKSDLLSTAEIQNQPSPRRDFAVKKSNDSPDALPTTVNVQYFSGITPPDTANIPTAKIGKGYWFIDADRDPAEQINIKLYWGNQELGNITDTSKLILAMYDMKNHIWLPFEKGTSGYGYSIINHSEKSVIVNGITRIDSVIFALTDSDQPLKRLRLDLNLIIAGFWYDRGSGYSTMKPDTITAVIRTTDPWTPVDSLRILVDSSGYGSAFTSIPNPGTGYYIEINHRNSLSTWSSDSTTGFLRVTGTYPYNFTSSQTQAYGSNLIQVGTKWCIINGDVNRDDWIDGSDYLDIFNNYDTGGEFITPDTNGDDWIDGSDYLIIFNNYDVGAMNPITGKIIFEKRKTKILNKIQNKIKTIKELINKK